MIIVEFDCYDSAFAFILTEYDDSSYILSKDLDCVVSYNLLNEQKIVILNKTVPAVFLAITEEFASASKFFILNIKLDDFTINFLEQYESKTKKRFYMLKVNAPIDL